MPGLAVAADVLAELAVEFGGLLHAVIEHGAPLFGVIVEGNSAKQEAGLEDDFEGVAEVVGEAANLFGLLLRNGFWMNGQCHEKGLSIMKCRAGAGGPRGV